MYCAMIGDLIGSKKLKQAKRKEVQFRLRQILDEVNYKFSDYLASPFLLTLGDEFQGLLTASEAALEIAEHIDWALVEYHVQVRYGLGIGEISTGPVNRKQALGDDGSAYHRAREGVDLLKKEGWTGFPVTIQTEALDGPLLWTLCQLLNTLAEDWSEKQRQYILDMESLEEQLLVAEKNKVQQSNISRALKRGHFKTFQQAKTTLKNYLLSVYDCPPSAGQLGLYNQAVSLEWNGKYAEALEILEKMLKEVAVFKDGQLPTQGDVLSLASRCYFGKGEYALAAEKMEAAIQEEKKLNEGESCLADKYAWLGRYCLELSEKAERAGNREEQLAQAKKVISVLTEGLSLCQNRPMVEMKIRSNLALAYGIVEGVQREIDFRLDYQAWLEKQPFQLLQALCANSHNLCCAYSSIGKKEEALAASKVAVQLAGQRAFESADSFRVYRTYAHLLLKEDPNSQEAFSYLHKALVILKQGGDPSDVIDVCKELEPLCLKNDNQEMSDWVMQQRLRAEQAILKRRQKETAKS